MTVRELYSIFNEKIPKSLSCEGDNDGLMCCPDGKKEVKRVLIALDVTSDAIEWAIKGKYDVILSHHPLIFRGLKSVDDEGTVCAKLVRLINAGISVMSFHTRLDALDGGVNDTLCGLLGLKNVEYMMDEGIPLGRVGELEAGIGVEAFAKNVKGILNCPFVLLSDAGVMTKRVAVLGGSGKNYVELARAYGADTFVSGRLDYHPMADEPDQNISPMNLIEAGHFYTEYPVCETLSKMLNTIDSKIESEIYFNNKIKVI